MNRKMIYKCSFSDFIVSRDHDTMKGSIQLLKKGNHYSPLTGDNCHELGEPNTDLIKHSFNAKVGLMFFDDTDVIGVNNLHITESDIAIWDNSNEKFEVIHSFCPVQSKTISEVTIDELTKTMLRCEYARSDEEIALAIKHYNEAKTAF